MTRMRMLGIGLAVTMLVASAASLAIGGQARPATTLSRDDFTPIQPFDAAAARQPAATAAPEVVPEAIGDFRDPERSFAPRPQPRLSVRPRVVVVPTPTPRPRPVSAPSSGGGGGGGGGGGSSVSGSASWYCLPGVSACHYQYSGGLYAAAGPALRVGDWRGRTVRVCSGGACVSVKLIDWCACYGTRVIDLYSDAFRRLAPLSSGTVRVTVSW